MVLESLINPLRAEKKPWEMFFLGICYSSLAALLSLWIFRQHSSLVMVFLTTMAGVPLLYATMKREEEKDIAIHKELPLLKEHSKALLYLFLFFVGVTASLTCWNILMPDATRQLLFETQTSTILDINTRISGSIIAETSPALFGIILMNNLKVLIFCILFSFLYGAGALFILTWNASVISAALGEIIRVSFIQSGNFLSATGYGIGRYMIHGLPEIGAYLIAGLAGGIISVAVINGHLSREDKLTIILDSSDLLLLSIILLVCAAFIEAFVTPFLFI